MIDNGAPFSLAFNAAVVTMANHVLPLGFDVEPDASKVPHDLTSLRRQIEAHRRFVVWSGASDWTIFGKDNAEVNYAFRAWHDWTHWHYCTAFDLLGERVTCQYQIEDMQKLFGRNDEYMELLTAEVIGQTEHYYKFGEFPSDQRAFVCEYLGAPRA